MVVDNAAGLQMGIDRDRTHIFQSPLFQVGTDPVRQTVSGWDVDFLVAHIEVSLSPGKLPDVLAERAKLFPYLLKTLRIVNNCE